MLSYLYFHSHLHHLGRVRRRTRPLLYLSSLYVPSHTLIYFPLATDVGVTDAGRASDQQSVQEGSPPTATIGASTKSTAPLTTAPSHAQVKSAGQPSHQTRSQKAMSTIEEIPDSDPDIASSLPSDPQIVPATSSQDSEMVVEPTQSRPTRSKSQKTLAPAGRGSGRVR